MIKIVVIGSKGQVGNEFQAIAKNFAGSEFFFYDKDELDIQVKEVVDKKLAALKPHFLINCAAYTAVDKAETDKEIAFAINSEAVGFMAAACRLNNTRFIHISTDYVFDGTASSPYKENDDTNPASVYGETKLEGEREALRNDPDAIIIRTAWVYSAHGNNFVKTMLRLMNSKETLSVVADQHGSPTYAADLAEAIMQIIMSGKWVPGIYHYTNDGVISWFDFASHIQVLSGTKCTVTPITTDQYPTPAKRPKYSVLDKSKIQNTYQLPLKDWKQSLESCLALLSSKEIS